MDINSIIRGYIVMRSYKFTALCASGDWKTFEFEASGYREARELLNEFIRTN